MIHGIGGGARPVGAGIRFGQHVHGAREAKSKLVDDTTNQRQLLNIRDTYDSVKDLRKAFELLEGLKPKSNQGRANRVGGGTGVEATRVKDYGLSIKRSTGTSGIISSREATGASVSTKAARLRSNLDIGSTLADSQAQTRTRSLLDGLSKSQLKSQFNTAKSVVSAAHDSMLKGETATFNGSSLSREQVVRALATLDYAGGGSALGSEADAKFSDLKEGADLHSFDTDSRIKEVADRFLSGVATTDLGALFGEVVGRLKEFDLGTLQGPSEVEEVASAVSKKEGDAIFSELNSRINDLAKYGTRSKRVLVEETIAKAKEFTSQFGDQDDSDMMDDIEELSEELDDLSANVTAFSELRQRGGWDNEDILSGVSDVLEEWDDVSSEMEGVSSEDGDENGTIDVAKMDQLFSDIDSAIRGLKSGSSSSRKAAKNTIEEAKDYFDDLDDLEGNDGLEDMAEDIKDALDHLKDSVDKTEGARSLRTAVRSVNSEFSDIKGMLSDLKSALPSAPTEEAAPTRPAERLVSSESRDQLLKDLALYQGLKERLGGVGGLGDSGSSRIRSALAIGNTSSDVTTQNNISAKLDTLSRSDLEAMDAKATQTLDSVGSILDGSGSATSFNREDVIFALAVKDHLAGTETSRETTTTQYTAETGVDVNQVSLDDRGSTLSFTGDPDQPTGFKINLQLNLDDLDRSETVNSLKTRQEALGLDSPIKAGSFEFAGVTIQVSENQTIDQIGSSILKAGKSAGLDMVFDESSGQLSISGSLNGQDKFISFGNDSTGMLKVLGIDGLNISMTSVETTKEGGGLRDRVQNRIKEGSDSSGFIKDKIKNKVKNKFSFGQKKAHKQGTLKIKTAFEDLGKSLGLKGMGRGEIGAELKDIASTLASRDFAPLTEISKAFEAIAEDQQFVAALEQLGDGSKLNDLASILAEKAKGGNGSVFDAGLEKLEALEHSLEQLLAA